MEIFNVQLSGSLLIMNRLNCQEASLVYRTTSKLSQFDCGI